MPGRSYSDYQVLHDADSDTGASTNEMNVTGLSQVALQIDGNASTYAATIQFEVTLSGSDWEPVLAVNQADGSLATTVTNSTGIFVIPVGGFSGFRTFITAYTDGNINAW